MSHSIYVLEMSIDDQDLQEIDLTKKILARLENNVPRNSFGNRHGELRIRVDWIPDEEDYEDED